jgi:hypothetical protein
MLCKIDYIMQNILHVQLECGNILHNIVGPAEHCYGYE